MNAYICQICLFNLSTSSSLLVEFKHVCSWFMLHVQFVAFCIRHQSMNVTLIFIFLIHRHLFLVMSCKPLGFPAVSQQHLAFNTKLSVRIIGTFELYKTFLQLPCWCEMEVSPAQTLITYHRPSRIISRSETCRP